MRGLRWSAVGLLTVCCASFASGLLTPFIDVDAGDIAPGSVVPVKGPGGDGFLIFNEDDSDLNVHMEVLSPTKEDPLHRGLPLPDPAWVRLETPDLQIAPHQKAVCRIMIAVPANARPFGKTFQAIIVTHGVRRVKKGINVRIALQSHLRFRLKRA